MKRKLLVAFALCSALLFAKIEVATSIAPQKALIDAIGGANVNTTAMIPAGSSPHSYEPKPAQMLTISKAKAYFTVGIEFEGAWMPRFQSQNRDMLVVDSTKGIKKIKMAAHHDKHEKHNANHTKVDPHVWTTPKNMAIMATNIKNTLVQIDPKNSAYYIANYKKVIQTTTQTDKDIKSLLGATPKGSKFMIFHPSWGYFANDYGLVQIPIELEGKEPKAKDLITLIDRVKKEHIKAIFVAPEFSAKSATQISNATHVPVVKISNLGYNWQSYMISFAKAVSNHK